MKFNVEENGQVTLVSLTVDALDASNSKEFKESVTPLLNRNKNVVFDMSRLEFVDSSGLGAILSCLRKLNADGGELKLCEITKPVRSLFELVRMHRVFDVFNTKKEALDSF